MAALRASDLEAAAPAVAVPVFEQLSKVGPRFSFALLADPQVEGAATRSAVAKTAQRRLSEAVDELNSLPVQPAFVVVNGDLVNSPVEVQFTNFSQRISKLKAPVIVTHGNHDGHHPYPEFKAIQRRLNGSDGAHFSFDCGAWHFLTIPCNFPETGPYAEELLRWLEADLARNRDRPTIAFIHYHLMPQGLSQLEWYTYDLPFRTRLLQLLTRHGNVRWVVHGHVHNGIQASTKISWRWNGTNFLTAPTITASRSFGEEFEPFKAGMDHDNGDTGGGYYLLFDIDGDRAAVRGRLAGTKAEHVFPEHLQDYRGEEPLWFKRLTELKPLNRPTNGDFGAGLSGWTKPHRYRSDNNPGFVCEPIETAPGAKAIRLFVREKGQPWAQDELSELYQWSEWNPSELPVLTARFRVDDTPVKGGGCLRICGYRDDALAFLWLLHWGTGDRTRVRNVVRNTLNTCAGERRIASAFIEMGRLKRALFVPLSTLTNRWHDLSLNLPTSVDSAAGKPGTFAELGLNRILLSAFVWCHEDKGSRSGAILGKLDLSRSTKSDVMLFDGKPIAVTGKQFETDFGLARLPENRKRA